MEDSEMDMVIPLQLNLRKKTLPEQTKTDEAETAETSGFIASESHISHQEQQSAVDSSPPTNKSTVLGPTQAKKRLLAFAQQWGKTKENLEADKCLEKHTSKHGTLKYTFIVRDEYGKKTISFPARLISYTLTEPAISYSPNPRYASGAYQSKKEVLDSTSPEEKQIMYFIMNSSSPSCQSKEFPGRYRKWYASRNSFVGKPDEEEDEKYSPHWESSDDELDQYMPPSSELNPLTTSESPSKVVSKVKINKVELPFFEDDDFLDSLMAKVSSSSRREKKQDPSSDPSGIPSGRGTAVSTSSTFDGSFEGSENRALGKSKKRQSPLDWEYDGRHSSASFRRTPRTPDEKRKRRSSSKSFKEESEKRRRNSFSPHQNETGRRSSSRLSSTPRKEESERRRRNSFSPRLDQNETGRRSSSRLSSTPRKEEDEREKESTPLKEEGESFWKFALEEPANIFGSRNNETAIPFLEEPFPPGCGDEEEETEESESKRLSLDQRLELELGIKIDAETSRNASYGAGMLTSPLSTGQRSTDDSPAKRRTGFGPKAAPIATLIFQCPKALPAQPYIPPHLQNRLCRPLTRVVPASSEETGKEKEKKDDEDDSLLDAKEGDSEPRRKNWDKELKHLEALASNLEVADDAIWQELEEKLLLFEMANIFASSGPESPREEEPGDADNPETTKETDTNHLKEDSPPSPIEPKEPGKSILVMPRISLLLDEANACLKKSVLFADSVRPGCGTSSEEDDAPPPVRSPPQSTLSANSTSSDKPKSKLKRRKKQKFTGPDYDPVYDLMPPPPPPPGSPPPHLPQGRNSPLASVDDLESPSSLTIPHSPCPVEPGPC